jgi:hypothetical protein
MFLRKLLALSLAFLTLGVDPPGPTRIRILAPAATIRGRRTIPDGDLGGPRPRRRRSGRPAAMAETATPTIPMPAHQRAARRRARAREGGARGARSPRARRPRGARPQRRRPRSPTTSSALRAGGGDPQATPPPPSRSAGRSSRTARCARTTAHGAGGAVASREAATRPTTSRRCAATSRSRRSTPSASRRSSPRSASRGNLERKLVLKMLIGDDIVEGKVKTAKKQARAGRWRARVKPARTQRVDRGKPRT